MLEQNDQDIQDIIDFIEKITKEAEVEDTKLLFEFVLDSIMLLIKKI